MTLGDSHGSAVSKSDQPVSIAEFLDTRCDLPEGGQWAELDGGHVQLFEAPDSDHGLVVSHLTTKFTGLAQVGTPVFRPQLRLATTPDTLRIPAVAYFSEAGRFDLMDADSIEDPPAWVIEVASTGDRRRAVPARVAAYRRWGVQLLWIIDPRDKQLTVIDGDKQWQYEERSMVSAKPIASIEFPLGDLFAEPEWWGAKS